MFTKISEMLPMMVLMLQTGGRHVILPSSHLGSPCRMYQLFQDSTAICRHCRKPDLFLTMTTNPKWPEITEALLQDQTSDGKRQTALSDMA